MPVSPDLAADLAKVLRGIYIDGEEQLLARIARSLAAGIDAPDWAERQLRSVQQIKAATEQLILLLTDRGYRALAEALQTAYNRGIATAGTDLTAVGEAAAIAFGGVDPQAITALVESQQGIRDSLARGGLKIASSAPIEYRQVIDEVVGRMLTGAVTRQEAAVQAMSTWAGRGVTRFTDARGRNWDLASYAEMATRTAAGQAMVQGHVDRLQSAGYDLVQVSDAPEECKLCRPWEGKVLSIGDTKPGRHAINGHEVTVAGTLRQARDDGLFHPNCRHRTMIYVPGRSKPLHDTADPEGDRLRQAQRAKERRVRELKRQVAALEPFGYTEELRAAKAKLRIFSQEFKSWREENGRKNLAYRTSVTSR